MAENNTGKPQITPEDPEHINSRRDPEERPVKSGTDAKEKSFDKTLADSFPTSDPPSTIPDPGGDDAFPKTVTELMEDELEGLPIGSWAALSIGDRHVLGVGTTREEAVEEARANGHTEMSLVCITKADDDSQVLNRAS